MTKLGKQKFVGIMLFAAWLSGTQAAEVAVGQQNKVFISSSGQKVDKIKIQVGDTVTFKNLDPFLHNVFSASDINVFDLGSFPKGESRSMKFDKKGSAEIECAVHPNMMLKIDVE